jgi:hypothetical protein
VKIINDVTFEVTTAMKLRSLESAGSVDSIVLGGEGKRYIVVGTSERREGEDAGVKGRLLVFEHQAGRLQVRKSGL